MVDNVDTVVIIAFCVVNIVIIVVKNDNSAVKIITIVNAHLIILNIVINVVNIIVSVINFVIIAVNILCLC